MTMTRIRMGLLPGLLLVLALALAGCGGGGNDGNDGVASLGGADKATTTSPAGGDFKQQALAYARCMRQHGINLPDPKPGEGINVDGGKGVNPNDPKFKAADQACQQYVPKGAGEKQTQQQSAGGGSQ
jgi:hypothetical protein